MKTRLLLSIVFAVSLFALAPSALAGALNSNGTCDTDNYTLADCQAACAGTWNSNTNTCTPQTNPPQGGNPSNPPQGTNPSQIVKLINPLNLGNCSDATGGCLAAFLNKILDFVIMIGAIVVMFMLVFIGFKYVVSAQKPGEIEKVHTMFLWTIVGALILIGAKAISLGIQATVKALSVGQ